MEPCCFLCVLLGISDVKNPSLYAPPKKTAARTNESLDGDAAEALIVRTAAGSVVLTWSKMLGKAGHDTAKKVISQTQGLATAKKLQKTSFEHG